MMRRRFYCAISPASSYLRSAGVSKKRIDKMSMSTYTTDKASPFARAVVSSMRKLYVLFCCGVRLACGKISGSREETLILDRSTV